MKNFIKSIGKVVVFCIVMMALCSFAYPLAVTGVSQVVMKDKANGNLIDEDGSPTSDREEAVGSALVGQDFTAEYFFRGRVSSVNYNTYTKEQKANGEYAGVSSGSFNYGNSNPALKERMEADLEEFLTSHPDVEKEEIPSDLLTASGSGLDPHISPKAAEIQINTVAENSGLSKERVKEIVEENTEHKLFGIFGEERVNVLKCNLAVAKEMGSR